MRGESRNAALWSLVAALAGAALIALQMRGHLVPRPDNRIIWGLSVLLLLTGIYRAATDIRRLRREWAALDQLTARAEPERLAASFPGTTVGERAALVNAAVAERRVDREFRLSNRAEAASSLDSVGGVTRFMGSALLVLAVMGTFAGMKGALPYLQAAIMQASAPGAGIGGSNSIGTALAQVSDAFGANFVALFGSLLLGAAAFGATVERRRFLSRLEHLSERYLYRLLPADADASEMQKAVYELQRSVTSIADIGSAVEGLGSGIGELKVVLRDTLAEMHTSFNDSVRRHGVELQTQLNATVSELTATLAGTTRALESTAVAYEGLVKGLEERDLGIARASATLEAGVTQLQAVQGAAAAALADAATTAREAVKVAHEVAALGNGAQQTLITAGEGVVQSAERVARTVDQSIAHLVEVRDTQLASREAVLASLAALAEQARGNRPMFERLLAELAHVRQQASDEQRAAATYVAAESAKQAEALRQGLLDARGAIDSLGQAQRASNEESGKTGGRLVGAVDGVQQEVALTRRDLGMLAQALLARPVAGGPLPESVRGGNGAVAGRGA